MGRSLGPLRTGFRYGVVAVVIALVADLRFLFVNPAGTPDWILTVFENYRTTLALAAFLFLGILAAIRVRPDRTEEGVPYRSLLLRDCTLAATVVAVMAGVTLFFLTALNATVFAEDIRDYVRDAAPSMVAYYEKVAGRMDDPPPLPALEQVESNLQPPTLRDLGRSIFNFVLRALLLGFAGALVGVLRGSSGRNPQHDAPPAKGTGDPGT
ncbi:MAG TPA: hypothetical protein VKA51_13035 [Rubrobacteraceae bacterium]|nr:hypothetical protein [Rubrobacteraceae bacterium]